MKHFAKIFCFIVLLGLANNASFAYDFKANELCYKITSLSDRTCEVAQNTDGEYTGDIVIPSTVVYEDITFSVTAIGPQAFENCTSLNSLTIPPSVTYISSLVFTNCYGLNKVVLQDSNVPIHLTYNDATSNGYTEGKGTFVKSSLREIYIGRPIEYTEKKNCGYSPFYKLKSLKKVEFSSNVKNFGTRCFYECSNLEEVIFSESIESISDYSFSGCTSLTQLNFNEGLKSIGSYSFNGCTGLTTLSFPKSLETIKSSFRNCTGLVSVDIPDNVLNLGDYVFCGCTSLKNVKLPTNLTVLEQAVFQECSSLETVELPSKLTVIKSSVFENCSSLKYITIPEGVTELGTSCFYYCTSLSEFTVPQNVTYLGWSIFDGCSNLKNLYVKPLTPPTCENSTFAEILYISMTLNVAPEAVDLYKSQKPWSNFLKIQASDFSGIDDIMCAPIECPNIYYDLQGNRVHNPINGIFIEKQANGKIRKILK
ncbi:MAG: leucine-rich repeat domain-containing protein [Candidatus Limisoma sp.]